MFVAFHYPFFGSTTVDAHILTCPSCGISSWKERDINTCNPGDEFECLQCGKKVWINWGLIEPDHLSGWISSEHCPHRLCRLKYRQLRKEMGWDTARRVELQSAIDQLMRVHYNFFMSNPRFWYERDLQQADMFVVVAASDLRRELC